MPIEGVGESPREYFQDGVMAAPRRHGQENSRMSTIGYSLARKLCSSVHTFSRVVAAAGIGLCGFCVLDEWVLNCPKDIPRRWHARCV
jgi:hypothetical protein